MKRFSRRPATQAVIDMREKQGVSTAGTVPASVVTPTVQPPEAQLPSSHRADDSYGHQDLMKQEFERLCNWAQEVDYLTSEEGQALNKDKAPSEHPVRADGTHFSHTMEQLQSWMTSRWLPEDYVISSKLKIMNISGKKPVELFNTLVLPVNRIFGTRHKRHKFEGMNLACIGYDGELIVFSAFLDEATRDFKTLTVRLASLGVGHYEREHQPLNRFIDGCSKMRSLDRVYLVEQAGFVPGRLAYVSHEGVLQRDIGVSETKVSYQIRKALSQLASRGTLPEWKEQVAALVRPFPLMQFAMLSMLTNVLINLQGKGTAIVHIYGESSVGKTTLVQVAQSVVGRATDPSTDGGSAIRKWHNTENALLSLIEKHHGVGLVLDELGSFSGKDFGQIIYALSNGQEKGRCNNNGEHTENQNTSALCILSTGELSMDDYLRKTGKRVNSGTRVRMLNIEVYPEDTRLPGETLAQAKARIDQIKAACGMYYGTALPALVQGLLNLPEATSYEALQQLVQGRVNECAERLVPLVDGAAESSLIRRGLDFFAMVFATGLYCIELGVLPYTEDEVIAAVVLGANRWVSSLDEQPDDVARAIRHLKEQVVLKRHQFPDMGTPTTRHHMGVVRNNLLLLRTEWFKELVPQFDKKVLARLEEQGYLIRTEEDRMTTRIKSATAGIYDGQYYAFDYDKMMGLDGGDDMEPEVVQPPKTTRFTRRPTCSQNREAASPASEMQGLTASAEQF
jgi:putative DNA primase/helicase